MSPNPNTTSVRVRIDAARDVVVFDAQLRCVGHVTLTDLSIDAGRQFATVRYLGDRLHRVRIEIEGRVAAGMVTGTVRAIRMGCETGRVRFASSPP